MPVLVTISNPEGEFSRVLGNHGLRRFLNQKGHHTHGYRDIWKRLIPCDGKTYTCYDKEPTFWQLLGITRLHDSKRSIEGAKAINEKFNPVRRTISTKRTGGGDIRTSDSPKQHRIIPGNS